MFSIEGYDHVYSEGGFIPGFFVFNSDVTFKEYSYTTDADAISEQMQGVSERLADYDDKADHHGTSFHEE